MAYKSTGLKKRKNMSWKKEDTSHVYSKSSSNRGKNYNTGDNTMKKTKGYDSLQGENQEKRGRSKADAPRGKRKSGTKKRTKKGSK